MIRRAVRSELSFRHSSRAGLLPASTECRSASRQKKFADRLIPIGGLLAGFAPLAEVSQPLPLRASKASVVARRARFEAGENGTAAWARDLS